MANVVVAGGAGYLGTTLVELLLKNNHHVRVLDRCFFGEEPLREFCSHHKFELFNGDTRWPAHGIFEDADTLIDLSGISNDSASALHSDLTIAINRDGSIGLAKFAKASGVKQLIFSSSCSVYGKGDELFMKEDSECKPISLYAKCKLMAEEALLGLADDKFTVTVLRNSTFYGLSRRMRFDLLVNIMTARALRENKIFVVGGGNQWRPLLHVQDAAWAFLSVMNAPKEIVNKQIFNCGGDNQNFRVIEIAHMVRKTFPQAKLIEVPEDSDLRSYHVSFGKIMDTLGFLPKRNIAESIEQIKKALTDGKTAFCGNNDESTITLNRYINLIGQNPMLELEEKDRYKIRCSVEFCKHNLNDDDILNAQQALSSFFLTTGNIVKRFEEEFSRYLNVKRAIGTASCTDSLFLALKALGIGRGDEVITSPMTFVATANAIEHAGAKPVFVDVEAKTGNINAELIEGAITRRTKAIIPVHLYGQMCDMEKISSLAKKHSLFVIEDSAHCIEGMRDGVRPAGLSDAAVFSFYATKNITCAEGGAIATNNLKLAEVLVKMRLHGLSASAATRYSGFYKHYDMEILGYKANMSNVDASLLIGQLSRIEDLLARKEIIARMYSEHLSMINGIRLPAVLNNVKHARHLFTIWVKSRMRDEVIKKLNRRSISVAVNYRPVHQMKYYAKKYKYPAGSFKNAEQIGSQTISLPFYPRLSDREVNYVAESLREIINETVS